MSFDLWKPNMPPRIVHEIDLTQDSGFKSYLLKYLKITLIYSTEYHLDNTLRLSEKVDIIDMAIVKCPNASPELVWYEVNFRLTDVEGTTYRLFTSLRTSNDNRFTLDLYKFYIFLEDREHDTLIFHS